MSALSSDTHPKMEALQIQLWRQASPTRKMQALGPVHRNVVIEKESKVGRPEILDSDPVLSV